MINKTASNHKLKLIVKPVNFMCRLKDVFLCYFLPLLEMCFWIIFFVEMTRNVHKFSERHRAWNQHIFFRWLCAILWNVNLINICIEVLFGWILISSPHANACYWRIFLKNILPVFFFNVRENSSKIIYWRW